MRNRKVITTVSNRRSATGLEAARSRYISRAVKQGRSAEVRFARSAEFKKQYNATVTRNIVAKTERRISGVIKQQKLGSEGKKLLRRALSSSKVGTKKALQDVTRAAARIQTKGLKVYLNRKGFVRGIPGSVRAGFSNTELLRLQTYGEYYFRERELILKYNADRGNKDLERQVKARYKEFKSEQLAEYIESEILG